MKTFLSAVIAMSLTLAVSAADAPTPTNAPVTISLGARHAHASPARDGFTHTGAGNIDIAQPSPDTIVITMAGVAVAGGHPCKSSSASLCFELEQCLEVAFEKPDIKRAKLTIEGRVIGLLRSHRKGGGTAQEGPAHVSILSGQTPIATLDVPTHAVACGENLSVNCRSAPVVAHLGAGPLTLRQTWVVTASHPRSILPCKAASAEFAPDPALDPLWISAFEPFHGAQKKDFGFQVTIRVVAE